MRVLIAGCGDIGTALGVELAALGHDVWGIRRTPANLPSALHALQGDLTRPATLRGLPRQIDVAVYTAAPDASTDDAYRATYVQGLRGLLQVLESASSPPRRTVFASSTAVYGQTDGSWVDEASPTEPRGFRGRRLLEAEQLLAASRIPATVLRLGGLYGPGRIRLIDRLRRGEAACVAGPPLFGNRIHRDDAVGALRHTVELAAPAPLYLGVDHEPADECEVLRWLAPQLGLPAPHIVSAAGESHPSNKRCRNDRLVASGYSFHYPTFREGYAGVLRAMPGHRAGSGAAPRNYPRIGRWTGSLWP
jgi:nucleoside-diphosphate-sugar epimerase